MSVPLAGQEPASVLLNRRRFASLAISGAATLALPQARAQARLEKPRVTIAVGGKSAFYYLPLTIAEQLGFFAAEGLQVEIDRRQALVSSRGFCAEFFQAGH